MTQSLSPTLPQAIADLPALESVNNPIQIRKLHKHYGRTVAVRDLNLDICWGELFGLIGPDGAGKTTTFNILGGVMEATAGTAEIVGLSARTARNYIGYLTQQFSLYPDLSVEENINYSAGLRLVPESQVANRRAKYLKLMALDRFGDRLAGKLSGGMRQKLALCCALISEPQVLLLDEPTTGVDTIARREFWDILASLTAQGITVVVATPDLDEPTSGVDVLARQQFWQLINSFARNGTAILVTTHYMNEAEQCNRMCFMVAGGKVAEGSASEIKSAQPGQLFEWRVQQLQASYNRLRQQLEPWRVSIFGDRLHVVLEHPDQELPQVHRLLAEVHPLSTEQAGVPQFDPQPIPFSLEDAFIGEVQRAGGAPP